MHSKKHIFMLGTARAKTEIIKKINGNAYFYTPFLGAMEKIGHAPAYVGSAIKELADQGFIKLKYDHIEGDYIFIKNEYADIEIEYEDLEIFEKEKSFFSCTIL